LAVLFGTMVSPTDPVAVVAVFRRLGIPARLTNLVESESLLNDGTGVVLFTVALAATESASPGIGAAAWEFLRLAVGGLGLGLLVGLDVPWTEVRTELAAIAAAALIALLARAVAVYLVLGLLHPLPWRISFRWQHLVVWSGLRGAIAVALALSLTERSSAFDS